MILVSFTYCGSGSSGSGSSTGSTGSSGSSSDSGSSSVVVPKYWNKPLPIVLNCRMAKWLTF